MDDSFVGYRSKPKRACISSDSEEDEELIETSQTESISVEKVKVFREPMASPSNSDVTKFLPDKSYSINPVLSDKSGQGNSFGTSIYSTSSGEDVSDLSRDEIEDSCNESSSLNIPSKHCQSHDHVDKFPDNIKGEDSFLTESDLVQTSSKRGSDDFRELLVKPKAVTESNTFSNISNRTIDNVQAELSVVSIELEKHQNIMSTMSPATYPDKKKKVNDSILSLETIKGELEDEMRMLTGRIVKTEQEMIEPVTRPPSSETADESNSIKDASSIQVLDDDCVLLDGNSTAGSGISISDFRSTLKEKISHNNFDIVNSPPTAKNSTAVPWSNLPSTEYKTDTFGKQAMKTHLTQQSLTLETLATLHSALKACPSEDTFAKDPYGLKVELMPHQKHALAWLMWREQERPSGGILADDMGLGKTLTMISLILKSREKEDKENNQDSSDDDDDEGGAWYDPKKNKTPRGGTLVICPASLVAQWEKEIQRRCEKGLLSVLLYHGNNRETRIKRLARKDVVITTYNLMSRESGVETAKNCTTVKSPGPLHSIKWRRIILDEAHIVRNHKSLTALGVFELLGKHRWCLTGTPIQNKELDLFSLLKFLRCSPFDDLVVWKRWVDNKNAAGMQRLATMMKSLMLRRTKEQLQEKGGLQDLPSKHFETILVKLDPEELKIYKKIALFSSTLFMQFLGQRAEKEQYQEARYGQSNLPTWQQGDRPENQFLTNEKVVEMYRKMKTGNREVKSHDILLLLLRLRQICCHAGLIKEMLRKEDFTAAGVEDGDESLDEDLFSAMEKLAIEGEEGKEETDLEEKDEDHSSNSTPVLSVNNPILEFSRPSSKIRAVLDVILEKVVESDDKAVVVSQWTSMLNIVHEHLREMGVKCEMLSGSVPVPKRMDLVDTFNSKRNKFKVLLLSLTAGGVGLNLVGGNHLFLIDVHWNPQLEAQACDRVYRVGQTKPVHIYKFICEDTIEERIKRLQDHKLTLAENVLTGTKNTQASKLTLQDLKMLFGIGLAQEFPQ